MTRIAFVPAAILLSVALSACTAAPDTSSSDLQSRDAVELDAERHIDGRVTFLDRDRFPAGPGNLSDRSTRLETWSLKVDLTESKTGMAPTEGVLAIPTSVDKAMGIVIIDAHGAGDGAAFSDAWLDFAEDHSLAMLQVRLLTEDGDTRGVIEHAPEAAAQLDALVDALTDESVHSELDILPRFLIGYGDAGPVMLTVGSQSPWSVAGYAVVGDGIPAEFADADGFEKHALLPPGLAQPALHVLSPKADAGPTLDWMALGNEMGAPRWTIAFDPTDEPGDGKGVETLVQPFVEAVFDVRESKSRLAVLEVADGIDGYTIEDVRIVEDGEAPDGADVTWMPSDAFADTYQAALFD